MKRVVAVAALSILAFAAGVAAANKFGTPGTVLHIITVQWKADSTAEQRTAAVEGVSKMARQVPGIKNVWLKTLKVQPGSYNAVMVMEFRDEAAFKAYENAPAHREWEKIYLPIRQQSTTHDVTN